MPSRAAHRPAPGFIETWAPHLVVLAILGAAIGAFTSWRLGQEHSVAETFPLPDGESVAHFRPLKALPAIADRWSDAGLVAVQAEGVRADGHVDASHATLRDPVVRYVFFRPTGHGEGTRIEVVVLPVGLDVQFAKVTQTVNAKFRLRSEGLVVSYTDGLRPAADEQAVDAPRCSVARLWGAMPTSTPLPAGTRANLTYRLDQYRLDFPSLGGGYVFDNTCRPLRSGRSPT